MEGFAITIPINIGLKIYKRWYLFRFSSFHLCRTRRRYEIISAGLYQEPVTNEIMFKKPWNVCSPWWTEEPYTDP